LDLIESMTKFNAEGICQTVVPMKVLLGATAAQSVLPSSLNVPVSRPSCKD
jgi:hypothetical protein